MRKLLYCFTVLLFYCFTVFPVHAENDPFDLILENRNYEEITGSQADYNQIPFAHDQDPQATPPQLNTLIEGNGHPAVTSLWQIQNREGEIYSIPHVPEGYTYTPVVGLGTTPGQNILVPESGYDIGGGYEVMVLYADADSITFDYGNSGSLADAGYTIHLENFQVNPRIVALYNQAMAAGGNELPVINAGAPLGQASGNEVLVAIRDTGSFMDPLWIQDWWRSFDPATATALELELMNALLAGQPAQKFGACLADEPFPGKDKAVESKAQSFEITVKRCFFDPQTAEEKVAVILKAAEPEMDFPNNQAVSQQLHKEVLPRLTLFNYKPLVQESSILGQITYDVCESGGYDWFEVENQLEFKTPEWMEEMADTGRELSGRLIPQKNQKVLGEQSSQTPRLLAQTPGEPYATVSFTYENLGNGQFLIHPTTQVHNIVNSDFNPHNLTIQSDQSNPFSYEVSITAAKDVDPYTLDEAGWVKNSNFPSGGLVIQASSPDAIGLNYYVFATAQGGIPLYASSGRPIPQPTPTPRLCEKYNPSGAPLIAQKTCVLGNCEVKPKFINPLFQAIQTALQAINPCPEKTFVVTPKIYTPNALPADAHLRLESFGPFKVSGHSGSENAFEPEHALQEGEHEFSIPSTSTSGTEETLTEIYGQRGVKNSYDWVQKSLTPLRF